MVSKLRWMYHIPRAKATPLVYMGKETGVGGSIEGAPAIGWVGWCRIEGRRVTRTIDG